MTNLPSNNFDKELSLSDLSTSPPANIPPKKQDAKPSSFSWFKIFDKNDIKDEDIFALDEEVLEKDQTAKETSKESAKTAKDSFKAWFGSSVQKESSSSNIVLPSSPPNQSASLLLSSSPRRKEDPKGALHVSFNTTFDEELVSIVHNANSELPLLQSIQQNIYERAAAKTMESQDQSKPEDEQKRLPVDLRNSSDGSSGLPLSPLPTRQAKATTPMIKELRISATPPFDFVMTKLPPELFSVLTLRSLSIQRNEFVSIPPNITQLQALQQLILSHNHIKTLPDIKALTSLATLDVSSNQLQSLPSVQGMHLQQLLVHKNQLSSLPNLSDQFELEVFSASHNKLTAIPTELQKLSALKQLNLSHNTLTTFPDKKSKDFFQSMSLLSQLQMQHNKLIAITPSIGHLVQLTECNFSNNQLTSLPKEMAALVNLKKLDLSHNLLTGLFEDFSQLKSLECALLKDNKLTSLPSLKDLENLSELNVSNNLLSNMEHFANLPLSLRNLDIANNTLNSLPNDLARLHLLVRLDASYNNISSLSSLFSNTTLKRSSSSEATNTDTGNNITNNQPALPGLVSLKHLHISHNALQSIPAEIKTCQALVDLDLSENAISSLPTELRSLVLLETLSLQSKKSTYSPTSECLPPALNKLSFGNILINKRKGEIQLIQTPEVESTAPSMSVQVPALLACIKTIPHLLVMFALADCSAHSDLADILIEQDGLTIFWDLLSKLVNNSSQIESTPTEKTTDTLYCTTTIGNLYSRITSDSYRVKLGEAAKECPYHAAGVDLLIKQIQDTQLHLDIRLESIRCLGNLCHDIKCKTALVESYGVDLFTNLAMNLQRTDIRNSAKESGIEDSYLLQRAFNQLLNMMGAHDFLHFPPSAKRTQGIRILTMDGGGTRALVTLEILKKMEQITGRRITEMFDLIGGTSTGAVLATLVGIRGYPLDKCETLYKDLSHKVFAIGNAEKPSDVTGWSKFLNYTNMLKSGAFYKTKNFVDVISANCGTEYLIDTTQDERIKRTKVFYCSTLVSVLPPQPYLYRNYNYPVGSESRYSGNCRTRIFNGLRAATAAPFLFEEFEADGRRFQDGMSVTTYLTLEGGMVANNPCALAIHEAKCLWKGRPIECIVSLGTGKPGIRPVKSKSMFTNVLNTLIKSCTNVETVNNIVTDLLSESEIKYLRFNPIGAELGVELDETDDEKLRLLQVAAREYVEKHVDQLQKICQLLKDPILPE